VKRHGIDPDRIILGGYSHGGGVALLYAADHPEVHRVFSIAGNDFGEWARRTSRDSVFSAAIAGAFAHYAAQGWVRPAAGADRELPDNLQKYDVRARAALLADRELFLAAGLNDRTTALEDHMLPLYRELQRTGATQVRFGVYQADHSFGDERDQIASDLVDWIQSND
jgi:dienelactone hydrolase